MHRLKRDIWNHEMKVSEVMSRDVQVANAAESLQQAAVMMAEMDTGTLPVGQNGRLVGIVTDRDITVRGVALGKGPDTEVRELMS